MARLARGERDAFDQIFALAWPTVRQLCVRALGEGPDADDAAQLALEKSFFEASDYDPSRPALPWLLAIASWECATVLKRRGRRPSEPLHAEVGAPADPADPETLLTRAELTASLEQALGRLSESDREALSSAYFAEVKRASPMAPAERKRKERALTRLRALWRTLHGD